MTLKTCTMKEIVNKKNNTKPKKKNKLHKIPIVAPPMKSRRRARHVTTEFHRLTGELDSLLSNIKENSNSEDMKKKESLQMELEKLGGRRAYQDASILSTSFHRTSKWVFQLLTKYSLRPSRGQSNLRLLEVGAINTQLLSCPWLDVTAIDLISRHEKIIQCDFFSLQPSEEYDILVSSMVINCVPQAHMRGKMLQLYRQHLKPNGQLFLMLPLLCLEKSRFLTYDSFLKTLENVGFCIMETKNTPKIAFIFAKKKEKWDVQKIQKTTNKRGFNNFNVSFEQQ